MPIGIGLGVGVSFGGGLGTPPTPAAPVNTVAPAVTGTEIEGSTLSTTDGTWTGYPTPVFTYQWQADTAGNGTFANIGGATNNTYLLTSGENGDKVRCVVTATNSQGAASANSNQTGLIAALDTTPAAFTFTDVTGATLSTVYESNTITVTGINGTATVTITGGEYSKNGGSYTSAAGTAVVNDTFKVRHTSSGSNSTATNTALTIGGVSDTYTTTTVAAADTTPDAFTFTDITSATVSTVYESNTITVAGITAAAALTITGGEYSINGGAYASSATSVNNGDTVKVRHTSSASNSTATNTVLTIGGVSDTYTTTTVAASGAWYEDTIYDNQSVIADFNNDRYAMPAYGSELLTNVDFTTNTTGWTAENATLSVDGGRLKVTATAAGALAKQTFTGLTVGKLYRATVTAQAQISGKARLGVTSVFTLSVTTGTAAETLTKYFTATATSHEVALAAASESAWTNSGEYAHFDNVSVKEVNLTATGRTYGSELIVNGDFASSTGWTLGGDWAISGGVATHSATGSTYLKRSVSLVAGRSYGITYTVSSAGGTGGTYIDFIGGTTVTTARMTGNGTFTFVMTAVTGNNEVGVQCESTWTGNVDNLSVKEITSVGVYPKRTATFDEVFAYTAASTTARTYTDSGGTLRTMARVNLILRSQEFDNASWINSGSGSPTANSTTAPDGTATADTITSAGGTSAAMEQIVSGATVGAAHTFSCYIKPGTSNWAYLQLNVGTGPIWAAAVYFNVATGATGGTETLLGTPGTITISTTAAANGFYRCIVTYTQAATATLVAYVGVCDADNSRSSTAGKTIYAWGAQLEAGSSATAYIATTTAAVDAGVNASRATYATQATNLVLQSQFASGWADATNATLTPNTTVAPDGTTTAATVADNGTNGAHVVSKTAATGVNVTASTVYTHSVYAKSLTGSTWVFVTGCWGNSGVWFNLTGAGAVGTLQAVVSSATIRALANGWYRLTWTGTAPGTAMGYPGMWVTTGDGVSSYAGGSDTRAFWGFQVEQASYAGPYAATTTASASARKRQLRLENAGTNLLQRSQEFDNAWWAPNQITIGANAVTAPDGTLTADAFIPDSGAVSAYKQSQSLTYTTGTSQTFSCYLKNGSLGTNWAQLVAASSGIGRAWFNLSTGAVGSISGTVTSSGIVALPNGWYRCWMTFTSGNPGGDCYVKVEGADNVNTTVTGNGTTPAFYAWGAQHEQSPFATDYIPTTSASVTRAIETARFSPLVEAILQRAAFSAVARGQWNGSTGRDPTAIGFNGNDQVVAKGSGSTTVNWSPTPVLTATAGSSILDTPFGIAFGLDAAGRSITAQGGTVATDTNSATPVRTAVYFGRDSNSAGPYVVYYGHGYYDFVAISPERLPNATLQALAVPS